MYRSPSTAEGQWESSGSFVPSPHTPTLGRKLQLGEKAKPAMQAQIQFPRDRVPKSPALGFPNPWAAHREGLASQVSRLEMSIFST